MRCDAGGCADVSLRHFDGNGLLFPVLFRMNTPPNQAYAFMAQGGYA